MSTWESDNKYLLESFNTKLASLANYQKYNKLEFMFPLVGEYRRDLYPKQMKFFAAGYSHLIRAFFGGNGTGKTCCGGTEFSYHLTGLYPADWKGRKFKHPIKAWGAARENKQLKEAMQEWLFGDLGDKGTGLIPRHCLVDEKGEVQTWAMAGTANCIGSARIKHHTNGVFDGWSQVDFKTYAQGWQEFQGANRNLIWLDEEPDDAKIYAECIARIRGPEGKEGSLYITLTPLLGYSTVYLAFIPNGIVPYNGIHPDNEEKFVVVVTDDDVPHLSAKIKKTMEEEWKLTDPNSLQARQKGIAAIGSGRIYPIDESFVVVPKLQIPSFWPKAYGIDPGQANFAAIWVTKDPNTGILYVYDEYKHGKVVYLIHAEAIKNRGDWISGGIDPHEAVKPRDTGETVESYLESVGLHLTAAKGDPDALRIRIRAMFESGALKIIDNCTGLLNEIRTYRYDINDPNVPARNQEDHRCDALMYVICVFDQIAQSYAQIEEERYNATHSSQDTLDDSERSPITGY